MLKEIEVLAGKGLSTRKISTELGISDSTVRRILKKNGMSTLFPVKSVHYANCLCCGKTKNNFKKKLCPSCITGVRRIRLKISMILLKGGKCRDCNLAFDGKNYAVFDFHHLDGSTKDFALSSTVNQKTWGMIEKELEKCVLVCGNCHRLRHAEDQPLAKVRLEYIKRQSSSKGRADV